MNDTSIVSQVDRTFPLYMEEDEDRRQLRYQILIKRRETLMKLATTENRDKRLVQG